MPKAKTRKKDELHEQISLGNGRRRTRSMAADEPPKKNLGTSRYKPRLGKEEIAAKIMESSDDESVASMNSGESIGKNENISDCKVDDRITVTIRRFPNNETYKYEIVNNKTIKYVSVDDEVGMNKEDDDRPMPTETHRSTRNRKSTYKSLNENILLPTQQAVRKSNRNIPKTPTKRPPTKQNELESLSEGDENIIPNANLSPKRSKVAEARQISNTSRKGRLSTITDSSKKGKASAITDTPIKGKTTAVPVTPAKLKTQKKPVKLLESCTPTKAFSELQIKSPKTRKSVKPLENNKNNATSSKGYKFRSKKSDPMYNEYSSGEESRDDGDGDYDAENDSSSNEDEDDEDVASDSSDMYSPKRPKSTKKVSPLMKTPSKSMLRTPSKVSMETPTKLISRLSIRTLTPSFHRRTINVVKPSTPLQEARQKLHVSVLPKSLPCREEEFNDIYTFLHARLSDLSGGCIYVSGVPGTGKTATVSEVIRCLRKSVTAGKLNDFEFVEINGMRLSEPRQVYVQIWKQLSGNQTTWEVAQKSLHERFTTANSRRGMTLLLVDELDLLCTKRQDVVYNLLDWPSKSTAKLVVITIANTMDLPERILMGKVTSRLGLTRLTFPPYNHKQLEEIVVSRLKGYNAFSGETVQLVARKVAAVSGDARRALDICRRATEVAEMNDREMVTMMDVKKALDEMIASPKIQAIKACSDLEKVFLQAVCTEVHRTGVEEVLFKNVYFQLETLCTFEGEKTPNVTEALSMCARLGAWRLILCDHSRLDIHQRLLLNVSTDDVYFAIKNSVA